MRPLLSYLSPHRGLLQTTCGGKYNGKGRSEMRRAMRMQGRIAMGTASATNGCVTSHCMLALDPLPPSHSSKEKLCIAVCCRPPAAPSTRAMVGTSMREHCQMRVVMRMRPIAKGIAGATNICVKSQCRFALHPLPPSHSSKEKLPHRGLLQTTCGALPKSWAG